MAKSCHFMDSDAHVIEPRDMFERYLELRVLFDAIAIELLADRIIVLDGRVQGTVRTAATQSTLPEYPGDLVESNAYVRALAERLAHYAAAIHAAIEHAADVEDAATANIYTDISRGIETRLSFLDTYLHQ